MQIGVCQIDNCTDVGANQKKILSYTDKLSGLCDLILFPECALTGFSPHMTLESSELEPFLGLLKKRAIDTSTTIVLPSGLPKGELMYNAAFVLHADGTQSLLYKEGLTDSEKRFFTPGRNATRYIQVGKQRVVVMFCMEAAEPAWTFLEEEAECDAILWPGYWGWKEKIQWDASLNKMSKQVYENMKVWKTPLIQCNFSANDASDKRASGPEGLSVVVDENNCLVYHAANKKESVFVVSCKERICVESIF